MDWGLAYEKDIRSRIRRYEKLRREGSAALVRIPGTYDTFKVRDLDDDEIRSVAIYEAEIYTNRAINQTRRK